MSWVAVAATGASLVGGYLSSRGQREQASQQIEAAEIAAQVARETNDMNALIAAENRAQAWRMFEQQLAFAEEQQGMERLGGFDSMGNRIYWHPERGWVTELSPRSEQIQNAGTRQEILNRTVEDRKQRERTSRVQDLQREDAREAGSQLDALRNVRQPDSQDIADLLFARGEQGRSTARDDLLEGLLRTQTRQGNTSNIPDIFSNAAGQAQDDSRTAMADATLQGMTASRDMGDAERGNRANLYSIFRDRAAQPFNTAYQPAGAATQLSAPIGSGNSAALFQSAFANRIPGMPFQQPDFSQAGIALAQGNAASARGDRHMDALSDLSNFFLSDAGRGLFGGNTNRTQGNSWDGINLRSHEGRF